MKAKIKRRIAPIVPDRLSKTPVLLLEGPRGVGKSTLLSAFAAGIGVQVIDLDRDDSLRLATASPTAAVSGTPPVLIDEYQRAPALLDAIKARLNQRTIPGMALLAGSASFESLPPGAQGLTGRIQRLPIMPFTQTEIDSSASQLMARAFDGDLQHTTDLSPTNRGQYVQRVMRGGMPLALQQGSEADRYRWFEGHVRQSIDRDAGELRRIGRKTNLLDTLIRVVGQTGSVLSVNKVARDVAPTWETVAAHLELLESLFLVTRLPAWGVTVLPRSIDKPKIHVVDSGIGAYLLRLSSAKLARFDPAALTEFGHLLESFVVQDVIRQTTWLDWPIMAGYWRTRDMVEVDLVLERYDGTVVAIEVKAGDSIKPNQFSGLVKLRDRLGKAFAAGLVFYTGKSGYLADNRIHVLPVDRLWQPAPR